MAKRDVDRRANEVLQALVADKQGAIRDAVAVLDAIESVDEEIAALLARREELRGDMARAIEAAKEAGWKPRELSSAGIASPKALAVKGLTSEVSAPSSTSANGSAGDDSREPEGGAAAL